MSIKWGKLFPFLVSSFDSSGQLKLVCFRHYLNLRNTLGSITHGTTRTFVNKCYTN